MAYEEPKEGNHHQHAHGTALAADGIFTHHHSDNDAAECYQVLSATCPTHNPSWDCRFTSGNFCICTHVSGAASRNSDGARLAFEVNKLYAAALGVRIINLDFPKPHP
jgi:hypothetical protein